MSRETLIELVKYAGINFPAYFYSYLLLRQVLMTTNKKKSRHNKICPQCKSHVHVRVHLCSNCKYEFVAGALKKFESIKKKVVKTYTEKGKGLKQCSKCKLYIAARIKKCACGNTALKKIDQPKPKSKMDIDARHFAVGLGMPFKRVILIPATQCPCSLKSSRRKDVVAWIDDVIDEGLRDNIIYSQFALKYFTRYFYSYNSEDYLKVVKYIDNYVKKIM